MHNRLAPAGLLPAMAGKAEIQLAQWNECEDIRMPMVLSFLQGNLVQMSTQRDRLGIILSKTKHCQGREQSRGLVRTEI